MAIKLTDTQYYSDIADAIRAKLGGSDTYTPAEMAGAIESITGGLDIKKLTVTLDADVTGTITMLTDPQLLKARNSPNGFVCMRYLGIAPATAELMFWFTANFTLGYGTNIAYNSILLRAIADGSIQGNFNTKGLTGTNYNGHLNVTSDGGLYLSNNATYPLKAGNYEILAGIWE